MTTNITQLDHGGFVVSEHQCWVEGVYASREAAALAVKLDPSVLGKKWAAVKAADPNGLLTEGDLL